VQDLGSPPDDLVLQGLVRYTRWLSGQQEPPDLSNEEPLFVQHRFTVAVSLALLLSSILSLALIRVSNRHGNAGTA
jgi:hypothetical protein